MYISNNFTLISDIGLELRLKHELALLMHFVLISATTELTVWPSKGDFIVRPSLYYLIIIFIVLFNLFRAAVVCLIVLLIIVKQDSVAWPFQKQFHCASCLLLFLLNLQICVYLYCYVVFNVLFMNYS